LGKVRSTHFGQKCGWTMSSSDKVHVSGAGTTGAKSCDPVPFFDLNYKQVFIRNDSNAAIETMRTAFTNANLRYQYLLAAGFSGISLTWTPSPELGIARFVGHVCPQTLLENNDMLRGLRYADPSGIQTRTTLMDEFEGRSNVFNADDPDDAFLKRVIGLNE